MTHQVALSDAAYQELKLRKQNGESYSDVVLRLVGSEKKDPLAWLAGRPRISKAEAERRIAQIEADRDASMEPA